MTELKGDLMKKLLIVLLPVMLQGCSFIIGKHPNIDAKNARTYCFPCIDIENRGGGGLVWTNNRPVLGYTYKDFK